MMNIKTEVRYDEKLDRWLAVVDGQIRHRARSKDIAEKTIEQVLRMMAAENTAKEAAVGQDSTPASGPPADPFKNAVDFRKTFDFKIGDSVGIDVRGLVPKVDAAYVPFGSHEAVETIIASGIFYPSFISGPSGNGKSTMVEQICAKYNRPNIRINLNMMVDEDVLIGSKTLRNGNVEVVEGPVLIAMRTGSVLLLDEIDAGAPNTLLCLQPILEGKPYYFKLKNEIIIPAPGFNIIATGNTKGKGSGDGRWIGTNVLNEAFLERFAITFNQTYPSPSIEKDIIMRMMAQYGIDDSPFATILAKWADSIRKTFDEGGMNETMSTRRLGHIVRAYAVFRNRQKAVELCCNRFDHTTAMAFVDLYNKLCPEGFNV